MPSYERLTPRELLVLRRVRDGLSNSEIAERLVIGRKAVEFHLGNIYGKLCVSNRVSAVVRAIELGLIAVKD